MVFKNYTPHTAKDKFDAQVEFIDVRETNEYAMAHIPGAKLIPLSQMNERFQEIPQDREVVVYCQTGSRSAYLCQILAENGFTNLVNLAGGIEAWYHAAYPVE